MNVGEKEQAIPESWETIAIGEICDLKNGYAFKPSDWARNGLKIIRIQNLNNSLAHYNHYSGELRDRFIVDKGDLLFAWSGTPGTSFGAHVWRGQKAALNQHIFRVDFDETIILKAYFKYAINQRLTELIEKAHGGVGLRHVTKGKFEQTKIELPPYPEQHRIVAKIEALFSELDKGVESLKTAREQLKVYRQAVLKHAFEGKLTAQWREENADKLETPEQLLARIRKEREARYQQQLTDWRAAVKTWEAKGKEGKKPGKPKASEKLLPLITEELPKLPHGWFWVSLSWLLSFEKKPMTTGPFGTMLKKNEHQLSGVPVLGIENIGQGKYITGNKIFVTEQKAMELASFKVNQGDIVISRSGTVGEICEVPDGLGKVLISTNLLRVSLNQNVIMSPFFVLMFQGGAGVKNQVKELCKGSSRDFLNQSILKSIAFPICSLPEQTEVVKETEAKFSCLEKLSEELNESMLRLDTLRQSILKQAFSGQLVPQDPNDEPASVLLERIKAETAQQKPKTDKKQVKRKAKTG